MDEFELAKRICTRLGYSVQPGDEELSFAYRMVLSCVEEWREANKSMHPTSGSLRGLWASFWLRVLSALKHFTSPPTRG